MYRNLCFHFFVLTFCICINAISVHAQVFPIQSQINLIPPYSGNLSDYTSPGSQRISVTLTSNDITLSNYRVKLRITIEGLGITLRSKQNLVTDPFVLEGGSPLTLYGDDLLQYLNPQNLDFIGLSKNEYQRTGKLPEGVYRFIVEVLDYNRGTVVSNKGFTTAWIILNDPPILNLPVNNFKTKIIDPANIPFTWTPRHTGSPNAAFTTDYIFRLIEIWPSNRNPNDAFLTQQPLVEVETNQSQFVYGPGEPSLVPGRKYAWQVQARDTEGRDLFKNNGRSEVFVFQFGDAIEMPQNVRKETANGTTISIRWEASSSGEIPERFRVRYRPEGGTIWYEDVTTQYWHTLSGLQNNKPYDIQVRAETSSQNSDYTFNQRHSTTLPIVDENFQCGNPFNIQPPAMTTPLQLMNIGDIFRCADFDVQITEVSAPSTPGFFSGKGYAKVYLMNRANIEVAFSGTFNTEFQMVTGSFKSTYESGSKMSQRTEEMKKIGEKPPELEPKTNAESTLITITGIIDSVYLNNDGKIVVIAEDGQSQSFEQKKNEKDEKQEMIVKDAAGNNWTIDKDGNISKADASVAGVYSTRDSLNFVVTFKENEANHYGFDPDNSFTTPQVSQVNDKDYVIAWKSVEQGKQDFVDGFVDRMTPFPKKVAFKIGDTPMSIQPGVAPGSSKIIFPGGFEGDKQEMIAYANLKATGSSSPSEVILGKLNVVSYEYISRKVIVVPVNGVKPPDGSAINARLDKIYGQAVAGWEVTIADNFKIDESFIEKLDEEESGNLASYNKKMREFNRQYKNSNASYDRDAFYIFLIKGIDFKFDAFMPFKRGFGYVFVEKLGNNNETIIQTIAHELGHGAFNLRHTFDQHSVARGKTKNLMDYGGGEELKKYQWDYVHNPESVIGWLQDDEEGASLPCVGIFDDCDDVLKMLAAIKDAHSRADTIVIRSTWEGSSKNWKANYVRVNGVDYDGITVTAHMGPNKTERILASKYKDIDTLGQRGFAYVKYDRLVATILIEGDTSELSLKRNALRTYLYDGVAIVVNETKDIKTSGLLVDAAKKSVEDVLTFKTTDDAACNLCVRAALLSFKKDPVLFPKTGSYVFYTYDKEKDPVIRGEISGDGGANSIVNDFENLLTGTLKSYFIEEVKREDETFQNFWKRLQEMADNDAAIVGTYPGHVVMIVPGGLMPVVNNKSHTQDGKLMAQYKKNPNLEEGDKYGFSFTVSRGITHVLRILECGVNVKSPNAPIYANLDFKGSTDKVRWFRYTK